MIRGALSVAVVLTVSAASAAAQAQCGEVHGDSAFSGDPPPPCVPSPPPFLPLRFGLELQLGWNEDAAPLAGATSGIGAYADVAITRWLGVGGRFMHRGATSDETSDVGMSAFVIGGGPRFTLFTDEFRHDALRLGADIAGLVVVEGAGASGPVVEISLERQVGNLRRASGQPTPEHGTAVEAGVALRYQQGVGSASAYRAMLLSFYAGAELFSRMPEGDRPGRRRPKLEYVFAAALGGGASVTEEARAAGFLQLMLGFPLGKWLVLEFAGEAMTFGQVEADRPSVAYTFLGGVRVPRWFPMFVEVLAGYSFVFGPDVRTVESGPVIDFGAGLQVPNALGCGFGVDVGPWVRIGVGDRVNAWSVLGARISIRYDNLIRAAECS